jgi:hypothetical protein
MKAPITRGTSSGTDGEGHWRRPLSLLATTAALADEHAMPAKATLKKDDGTVLASYKNDNINLWGDGLDFVRPKWGFYRNQRDGAGEAEIFYNDMKIIRGTIGAGGSCTCK